MSIRQDLASEILEKYKSNIHYIEGYYSNDKINNLLVELQLEKYKPSELSTPPVNIKDDSSSK